MTMSTLYLIKDDFAQTGEIVRQFDRAGQWVKEAIELMRIAGEEARASNIYDVWLRAFEREPCILETADIAEILDLIGDFEEKLVGTVVDEN